MQNWWQTTFPQGLQKVSIQTADGKTLKLAFGEKGQGRPLVLVHGVGSWSYSWRHLIDPLAQQFRVICLDARGYGFSDKPPDPDPPGHQIGDLAQAIRALCPEPAAIMAESLGALVSLAVAQTQPDLVARLVLINVPIFPVELPSLGMRLLADLPLTWVRAVDQARLAYWLAPLVRSIVWLGRQEVVADPSEVSEDEVYWLAYPYVEFPNAITKFAENLQQLAREIRALHQGQPSLLQPIQAQLASVHCPTLILWSEQDRWFPVAHGEQLRAQLPNARLEILANCGHSAAAGCPAAVSAAAVPFLQDFAC
ncbi:alpha/beta fold hydrolase [Leptolyngbya sp. FACHB-261]|uniref:alpha/beta fold hydrolase n=1 Tax=Leptolyngbya sp. FACHB-261 TaxID=2692806 RepID=UPI001682E657|nr:alpha/beta hydrolase [Leptolyngbya sp. FACHB-261]MBD2103688.1 alpha/beta hydrolase [Leptolyngbya sp. FACHB-261]